MSLDRQMHFSECLLSLEITAFSTKLLLTVHTGLFKYFLRAHKIITHKQLINPIGTKLSFF